MVGVIIQARMGSSRLPCKSLSDIHGKPLLYYSVERAKKAKYVEQVIVATTMEKKDDEIEKWCKLNNVNCFRGSEEDVLDRYYKAASMYGFDVVVRATADNPFIDPVIIDLLVTSLILYDKDYVTMRDKTNTWPYGLDVEVMKFHALKKTWERAVSKPHREHVTMYIKEVASAFDTLEVPINENFSDIRLTVDYKEDFDNAVLLLGDLLKEFGMNFTWRDAVKVYQKNKLVNKNGK